MERARLDEVQALQARLDEQDIMIQATEEKLFCEKKKRKRAEEQLDELRSENAMYKRQLDNLQADHDHTQPNEPLDKVARQKKQLGQMTRVLEARNKTIRELRAELAKEE